jgi:hypothetical protein
LQAVSAACPPGVRDAHGRGRGRGRGRAVTPGSGRYAGVEGARCCCVCVYARVLLL